MSGAAPQKLFKPDEPFLMTSVQKDQHEVSKMHLANSMSDFNGDFQNQRSLFLEAATLWLLYLQCAIMCLTVSDSSCSRRS